VEIKRELGRNRRGRARVRSNGMLKKRVRRKTGGEVCHGKRLWKGKIRREMLRSKKSARGRDRHRKEIQLTERRSSVRIQPFVQASKTALYISRRREEAGGERTGSLGAEGEEGRRNVEDRGGSL